MIYVSSACSSKQNIRESVIELVNAGFRNIELSGGTEYYDGFEDDLVELKDKYNLNYLCHNYFPPPKENFVLNLASLNNAVNKKSFEHIENAIALSKRLNASKFGFHAGFFIEPDVNELGKKISKKKLINKEKAIKSFIKNYNQLKKESGNVNLYIENNVLSMDNNITFNDNPFMLTHSAEYDSLREKIEFNLLLDVAHLKVTCNSLGLDYVKELDYLIDKTDYIHISDNEGIEDSNKSIEPDSELFSTLNKVSLKNKTITLEIYTGLDEVIATIENIKKLM